jgi:hypothetical protein
MKKTLAMGRVVLYAFFSRRVEFPYREDSSMADIYHALGLTMHQPMGNLIRLHNSDEPWKAKQVLWCYDHLLDTAMGMLKERGE